MKILKLTLFICAVFTFSQSHAQQDLEEKQKRQFAKVDKNSDGFIDFEELKAVFGEKKTKDGKPFDVERMFKNRDANGDGKLEKNEYFRKKKKK